MKIKTEVKFILLTSHDDMSLPAIFLSIHLDLGHYNCPCDSALFSNRLSIDQMESSLSRFS